MKVALGIEYDGSEFFGWQRQRAHTSVQESLEFALSRVADESISVFCAGRTDTGVHAAHQVVHFETGIKRPSKAWVMGTNTHLPMAVRVLWAQSVTDDFHARFSAVSRQYRYVIYNEPVPSALFRKRSAWYNRPLNVESMQRGANHLIGEHDFSAFRASGCQSNTPNRCVKSVKIERNGSFINVDIKADAFLYHMVRNIVGTLLKVGSGEAEPEWVGELLKQGDRRLAAKTAPSSGLYLVGVEYPSKFSLPESVRACSLSGMAQN